MQIKDWQGIVAKKREQQQLAISAVKNQLCNGTTDSEEDAITAIDDIAALVEDVAQKKSDIRAITEAYIKRAIQAHGKTNCLTEVFFDVALSKAKLANDRLSEGQPVRPLEGVPMTLKDQFNVEGYDTTLGYTGRAFKPASEDATLVQMLQDLGAIMLSKTNLPQSIMWCETENPLWGLTTNPNEKSYTPGGSTGGESALLALHGSTVGWGTDIGGSIRIPSHMMGLYGLKPSSSRLPYSGVPVSTEGQEHVASSIGPLARSLSSIYTVMRELILLKPWLRDCRCSPIPWRQDVYDETMGRKLRIGVLEDDGVVEPCPAIRRVLRDTVKLLSDSGHEVVTWTSDLHKECIEVMDLYYTADGGEDIRRDVAAGGEPFIPHVEKLVNRGKAISVFEYWQLNRRKRALQQAYLEKWNKADVDILLLPVMPHPSVPHQASRWVGYTKVWNFLDYTALVVPAGKVEPKDCKLSWTDQPRNEIDEWNRKVWEQEKTKMSGLRLPVGVQIVGRNLEEEKVLAVGKIIDDILRKQ